MPWWRGDTLLSALIRESAPPKIPMLQLKQQKKLRVVIDHVYKKFSTADFWVVRGTVIQGVLAVNQRVLISPQKYDSKEHATVRNIRWAGGEPCAAAFKCMKFPRVFTEFSHKFQMIVLP
jgi:translation elongation factor EF-1alpha